MTVTTSLSQRSFMPPVEPYVSGGVLVFDTSAWNRLRDLAVLPRWLATAGSDLLAVCAVVALELLASCSSQPGSSARVGEPRAACG